MLENAIWRVDAANVAADGLSLTDLSGNGRHAVFGTAAAKPIVLPYNGEPYFYSPGDSGGNNWLSGITTTIIPLVSVLEFDYETQASPEAFYLLYAGSGVGRISVYHSGGFIQVQSEHGSGVENLIWPEPSVGRHLIKISLNGQSVSLSIDGAAPVTKTFTVTRSPTNQGLSLGSNGAMPPNTKAIKLYSFKMDATHFCNFRNVNSTYTSISNSGLAGGSWGISRIASGYKGVIVDRPLVLFGGGQFGSASGLKSITGGPYTVMLAARAFWSGTSGNVWAGLLGNGGGAFDVNGFIINRDSTNNLQISAMGATAADSTATQTSPTGTWTAVIVSSGSKVMQYFNAIQIKSMTVGPYGVSPNDVAIGRYGPEAIYGEFEFVSAAIFNTALSDAAIKLISNEMLGIPNTQYPTVSDFEKARLLASVPGALATDTIADLRMKKYRTAVPSTYNNNLLTPNQASAEMDASGWKNINQAVITSGLLALNGSKSIKVMSSGPGLDAWISSATKIAVKPNTTYIWQVVPSGLLTVSTLSLRWYEYNAGGVIQGGLRGTVDASPVVGTIAYTAMTTGPNTYLLEPTFIQIGSALNSWGEYDKFGLWEGTDPTWSMPGQGGLITVSDLEKAFLEGAVSNETVDDSIMSLRRKYYASLGVSETLQTTDDMHYKVEM